MATDTATSEIPAEEFLQRYESSRLAGLEDARAASAAERTTGSQIASRLVSQGVLSQFQANALLLGKASDVCMGNYEILDKLGVGGMGTVYKARHRRMKRIVALKVLSKSVAQSAMFAQRFQREVETIAKLQHPNVVMAFDADEAEEGPFLIMEFVDGRDLTGEVSDCGPLAVADAADVVLQAARGLECAHQQGIIHRDIKPSNLMRDRSGVVKVTDLGLARLNVSDGAADQFSLTQAGSVLGTVDYMAPEQAVDSTTVDARADIYSLGATLFFLLTGQPLYLGNSLMAVLVKHREAAVPPMREIRPDVPLRLEEIYRRMVAKKIEDRYATMTDVIADLEDLARTEALSDHAPKRAATAIPESANDQTVVLQAASNEDTRPSVDVLPPAEPVVVLVEPSRTQAGIIRKLLEQVGIKSVHTTTSGKDALVVADRVGANVIFSAMHLPDMTGVQLAHAMLAESRGTGLGFILATSESESQELPALPNHPQMNRLIKPFDLAKLRHSVQSVSRCV